VRLVWQDGFRFEGSNGSGRTVQIDADPTGSGLKPSDLVPLAVAACTAYEVVNILQRMRQPLEGLEATVDAKQEPATPGQFRRIRVRFVVRGAVDGGRARRALELADSYCSVSASLRPTVRIETSIEVDATA
jgi:putative redox protein